MTDAQPTQADRDAAANYMAVISAMKGQYDPVSMVFMDEACDNMPIIQAFARHAADAADEREAQVIAAVVARLRELSGDEPLPKGCTTGEVWLLRAVADQFERGDWKGPRNAE